MRIPSRLVSSATVAGLAPIPRFPEAARTLEAGTPPPSSPIVTLGATYWWDGLDVTSAGQQSLPNRVVSVADAQLGSTTGVDTNDPAPVLTAPNHLTLVTDDYLQLPAAATPTITNTTGACTIVTCAATASAGQQYFFSSGAGNDQGVELLMFSGSVLFRVGSATNQRTIGAGAIDDDTIRVFAGVVDTGTLAVYANGFGLSATGAIASVPSHITPRVGTRAHTVNSSVAGRWYATVIFPTALTGANLDDVATYLIGLR